MSEQTLEGWLADNLDEIKQAQSLSTSSIPDEPARLAQDLSRSQSEYARMGYLLADAEAFVLKAHAAAMMETRRLHPDLTADERKIQTKADPLYLKTMKLRDDLAVIVGALKSRAFAIMNTRNNTGDPRMSTES